MNYDVYDILTIDGQEYVVVSKVLEANKWYFLLNEIDEEENLKPNGIKIFEQSTLNNLEPDVLYPVEDEEELKKATNLLNAVLLEK